MILSKIILSIVVAATMDSTTIMIGDQTDLHLQATLDREARVEFPVYGEQITDGVEIVDRTIVDTVRLKDGKTQLNQYLTVTSFHDSLFTVEGIPFLVDGDTLWSAPVSLNVVQPFEVDTTLAITDIKGVMKAPVWVWGIIRWILLALAVIGLGVGLFYLGKYLANNKKEKEEEIPQEPLRPAEEVALERLDAIREQKIWQEGRTKEYHTELTDTVREYIGRRFEVHSSEKTSDDTLRELKPLMAEQKDLYQGLSQMLRLADLVKFAKWTATPEENELSLRTAYEFVHQTTPQAVNNEENENKENNA